MPRKSVFLIACGWAVFAAPPTAAAQSVTHGEVRGRVSSGALGPLGGAGVSVTDVLTGETRRVESDRQGAFWIPSLPPGRYEIHTEALRHRPRLHRGVVVRPGSTLRLEIALEPAPPPIETVDTVDVLPGSVGAFSRPGGARWTSREALDAFPDLDRTLSDVAARSARWDEALGTQGLPGRFTRVYLDGIPFTPARHPTRGDLSLGAGATSRLGLHNLEFLDAAADVEWAGGAGGYVAASSRSGGTRVRPTLFGSGSTDDLWSSDDFSAGDTPDAKSGWGGGTLDLPVSGDTVRAFFAVEGRNVETPRDLPPGGDLPIEAVRAAPGFGRPWVEERWEISGLSRLDWSVSSDTRVTARVSGAHLENRSSRIFAGFHGHASPPPQKATDVAGALTLHSRLGTLWFLDVRGGVSRSERRFGEEAGAEFTSPFPTTNLGGSQIVLGREPGRDGEVLRTAFDGRASMRLDLERHSVKLGVDGSAPFYEYDYALPGDNEFFFGDAAALNQGRGAYVGFEHARPSSDFTASEIGTFLQYTWRPAAQLRLTAGGRISWELLPSDEVSLDRRWEELTGLRTSQMPDALTKVGTRVAAAWDLTPDGSSRLEGSFAVHQDRVDPAALHEVISVSRGGVEERRAVGELGAWPAPPAASTPSHRGTRLAMLGPNLEAPRTTRGTLSLRQTLGSATVLRVAGVVRRTDFLLRRSDLNLAAPLPGTPNAGRPVFGELTSPGGVVQPVPGSNRRFPEFGTVWALTADGWSDYEGVDVSLEHATPWAELFGTYTYSDTEDNLVGLASGIVDARVGPNLEGVSDRRWQSGTSDLDVPHRAVVGARTELEIGRGIGLAALYRFRSGLPFTPRFAPGLDVNGDGSGRNDPALVPDTPEIAALARSRGCVRRAIGRLADRNGCRGPDLHTFDARIDLVLVEIGGAPARLVVEGLNLLDADAGLRNDVLLLPAGESGPVGDASDPALFASTAVNPRFGERLRGAGTGRRVRIGFRLDLR